MTMQAYKFRHLIWVFNSLIDSGSYDSITVGEVKKHASAGTISAFLIDRFGDEADFSIIEPTDWSVINEEWQRFSGIDERRKMGIENRGLCLLLGYSLQSFQQRELDRPKRMGAR